MKTTISVVGAGVGSFPGFSRAHPRLLEEAAKRLREQEGGLLIDSLVTRCGDGLGLVMTHTRGAGDEEIHGLVRDVLRSCARIATEMRLHGAGRDLLGETAEMEFEERESEPVLLFMATGARAGVWNVHLYKTFADPFTTSGLVSDPSMHGGFAFEVHDVVERRKAIFRTPEESYDLLACIGAPSRHVIGHVFSKEGAITGSASTPGPSAGAERQSHPVMIVRSESGFPAVGECLAPFGTPFLVAGGPWSDRYAPLMPVAVCDATRTLADGPPRAICLGFQVCNGRLIGPADLFDDPAFDPARRRCLDLADLLGNHGPFNPHRLPLPRPQSKDRWEPLS